MGSATALSDHPLSGPILLPPLSRHPCRQRRLPPHPRLSSHVPCALHVFSLFFRSSLDNTMEDVEQAFEAAAQYVGASAAGGTLHDAQLLRFYGLYKQATAGPCDAPKPSFFDRRGRAKWQAWKDAAGLSAEEAQQQYVQLLTEASPQALAPCGRSTSNAHVVPMRPPFCTFHNNVLLLTAGCARLGWTRRCRRPQRG